MNLWDARFKKEADQRLNDFNSSISIDHLMATQNVRGSMVHMAMLAKRGITSKVDSTAIAQRLEAIQRDIESGVLLINPSAKDIHMLMGQKLTKRIRDAGKRLHTARSCNDQVVLNTRMYCSDEVRTVCDRLQELFTVLCEKAQEHTETIMPGYMHLQRAQPITFVHHLMAYVEMFLRDLQQLQEAQKQIHILPLGSGALAATTYPIDREFVKEQLHFDSISMNSLDGVSDRDFCIEIAPDLSMVTTHLPCFAEGVIPWCSWELKFMELDGAFATGSSIVPQRKNPGVAELICGKTGRVYGDSQTLLTMMKGLPLAYSKDVQEDKEAVFDALHTVQLCLTTFTPMFKSATIRKDNMRNAAARGFINTTDCVDYLTKEDMALWDAYRVLGGLVSYAQEQERTLETLTLDEYKSFSDEFEEDIYKAISLETCVKQRKIISGPAPEIVAAHIEHVKTIQKEMDADEID